MAYEKRPHGPGKSPGSRKGQFQKGHAPLPGCGRPKGSINLIGRLKNLLEVEVGRGKDKRQVADDVIKAWIAKALEGSFPHLREMLDRLEGTQTLTLITGSVNPSDDEVGKAIAKLSDPAQLFEIARQLQAAKNSEENGSSSDTARNPLEARLNGHLNGTH